MLHLLRKRHPIGISTHPLLNRSGRFGDLPFRWILLEVLRLQFRRKIGDSKRCFASVIDQLKDTFFVREPHLDFGRVHVDINCLGWDSKVQHTRRIFSCHQCVAIGLLQCRHTGLGSDKPGIDEEILHGSRIPRRCRFADHPINHAAFRLIMYREQIFRKFFTKYAPHS